MSTIKRIAVGMETVEAARRALGNLAEKPVPARLSASEAIALLAPEIRDLLGKGYTKEEVAASLVASGIQVSGMGVMRYAARKKRKSHRVPKHTAIETALVPAEGKDK